MNFIDLYNQGLNDAQIAKQLGKSTETIRQRRLKLDLPSNFSYNQFKTIDEEQVRELVLENNTDWQIAEKLNCHAHSIYQIRKRLELERVAFNVATPKIITTRQLEILTGTLLGDSSLSLGKNAVNPRFSCMHGIKQADYCYWKYKEFESLDCTYKEYNRTKPNLVTGKFYESYVVRSKGNPEFLPIYNNLYINSKKVITKEFLQNYTDLSLAVHFMDDGSQDKCAYTLATQCFSKNDLDIFEDHLINNFGLRFSRQKYGSIYFGAKQRPLFEYHIKKHIHPNLQYKIIVT